MASRAFKMKSLKPLHAVLAFLAVAILSVLPLAFVTIPPMVDYPNHLARCSILAALPDSPALQSMYEPRSTILPDLAMDAVVVPLAHFVPAATAGKIFCVLVLLLMFTGGMALSIALTRKVTVWSFAPALLLFNHILTYGFLNYLFGIGLLLWGVATWIAMRERGRAARLIVGAIFALVLFFSHLIAMALFGCALAGYEIARWTDVSAKQKKAFWVSVAEVASLFVVPFFLLLKSPTKGEVAAYHPSNIGQKLDNILSVLRIDPNKADILYSLALAGGIVWLIRTKSISIDPRMRYVIAAVTGAFLLLPDSFATCGCVDIRVPIVVAFLLAAGTTLKLPNVRTGRFALAFLVCAFGFRTWQVSRDWSMADRSSQQVLADLSTLPQKAVVFTAHEKSSDLFGVSGWEPPLIHLPVAEILRKPLFFPQLFALENQHPLAIRKPLRNLEQFEGISPFEFKDANELSNVIQVCHDEADDMLDIPPALGRKPSFYLFAITTPGSPCAPVSPNAELLVRRPRYALYRLRNTDRAALARWKAWIAQGRVPGPQYTWSLHRPEGSL